MARSNAGWVYILDSDIEAHRDDDYRIFKIGRASNLNSRVKQLGTAYAYKPTISYAFRVDDCIATESELHGLFQSQRLNGEWFKLGYEDLAFISLYAGNTGYFEDINGRLLPDPMMPYSENAGISACIAELERDIRLSIQSKYFPLASRLDLPVCILEAEEDAVLPTEPDPEEEYAHYLDELAEYEAEQEAEREAEYEREQYERQLEERYEYQEEYIY